MVQSMLTATPSGSVPDSPLTVCDTHRKLYFTLEFKDIQAKQGTAVKLLCSVTGFDPIFKWYKDSRPLSWNTNCLNMTKGVIGTVRLGRLTPSDAGEYKCIVQNAHGTIETKCHLSVLANPDMPLVRPRIVTLTDYYVFHFDELVLAAHIDSSVEPVIKFYKDGCHLHMDEGKYSMMIEEGMQYSLVISHPSHEDSGLYTIKVKNDAGEESAVHRIEFLGRESHRTLAEEKIDKPTHRRRRRNAEEEQMRDYAFERLLEKREQLKKIKSTKTESSEQKNETTTEDGEPAPEPVKPLTRAERREKALQEARNRLTFEATLKDIIQLEGTTAKFVCSVTGPDPTFKWYKNDEPINFTKTLKNDSKLNVGSISILNITPKDSGTYKCEVSNKLFKIESEAKLTVLQVQDPNCEPPTITRAIKEYYTVVTDDLILEIRVRGNPRPKIQWIKDCLEVDNEEYFAPGKFLPIREAGEVYKLAIHDPQRSDSGRYMCIASNPGGKVEISHDVKVLPKAEYAHVHGIIYADVRQKKIKETVASRRASQIEILNFKKEELTNSSELKDGENENPEETVKKPEIPEDPKFAIKLLSQLKNLCTLEGSQARLVFSIDGYRPECKWFKDDEPLEMSGNVKNISKDTIGGITIQKVTANDEGTYKCVISNRYCEVSTKARLEVIRKPEETGQPPMFTRKRHYYDQKTDQLIMEVQISGLPLKSMIWYKDCREVVNNDKYLLTREPNGVYKLYIDSPIRRDCGTYVVQVENYYGAEQLKHEIEFWDKNDFVHANRVEHADPKNKWKKIETVPVSKKNELIEENKAVTLQESSEEKPKRYRPFEMPPEISRAEKKKQQYKLEFITTLRNHTVVKGSNIKLSCCTSDANRLKVTWLKDGEPIEKDNRVRENLTKEGLCTLELLRVTSDDSGTYECTAKTPQGEASNKCKVTVYELEAPTAVDAPPVLATSIVDYYRPAFNDIVIECKITGTPKPRVKWIRDGLAVEFGDKYEYYHKDDGTCTLVVNQPRMIDSGKYIIIAKNHAGELELTHELEFEGPKISEKRKNIYSIEIENETKPRVYPKPKEPTPEPVIVEETKPEEEQVEEEQEIEEEAETEIGMNLT
uniref:CSON005406 protein n=1 Tax=Culicoides sonorensis TaxID=179676 RepID=A0A336MUJ6_CULSO